MHHPANDCSWPKIVSDEVFASVGFGENRPSKLKYQQPSSTRTCHLEQSIQEIQRLVDFL